MHSLFLLGSIESVEQEMPHPQVQMDAASSRVGRQGAIGHALLMFECGIALGVAGVVLANRLQKQQDRAPVEEARISIGSSRRGRSRDSLGQYTNSAPSKSKPSATIE